MSRQPFLPPVRLFPAWDVDALGCGADAPASRRLEDVAAGGGAPARELRECEAMERQRVLLVCSDVVKEHSIVQTTQN
jgi:hypothetical protein